MKDLADEGDETKAWRERPEVPWPLHTTMSAFWLLSASRPVGLSGVAPIPLTEVKAYCDLFGISDLDDIAEFVSLVREMDTAYIDENSKKTKSSDSGKGKK